MSRGNGQPPILPGCDVAPAQATPDTEPTSGAKTPKRRANRRKARDRFGVLNKFVDTVAGTLERSDLLVWLVLYRDTRDGVAATAQREIARRVGLCERTVRYALGRLERQGLVTRLYRGGINRGPSRYRVECEPNKPARRQ